MISLILKAVPWGSIFSLGVKGILYWLEKAEHTKEMKRDFLKFVDAFHEHRQIPVRLNDRWEKLVKEHQKEMDIDKVNENLTKHYTDQPYSEN